LLSTSSSSSSSPSSPSSLSSLSSPSSLSSLSSPSSPEELLSTYISKRISDIMQHPSAGRIGNEQTNKQTNTPILSVSFSASLIIAELLFLSDIDWLAKKPEVSFLRFGFGFFVGFLSLPHFELLVFFLLLSALSSFYLLLLPCLCAAACICFVEIGGCGGCR
jgi:hypothetical protein